ncbi:MAG: flagellar motor protein MotB [Lachnospiraceae bacterium]|nr:flagellar motor protein MotB [Lachnospiraceae bacterium]
MAKKHEDEPPAGSPAWMATFSDLMNLLLCFFVLLFSMSTIEEAKWNELVASLNSSFSIFDAGSTAIGEGILISNGVSQLNELDQYINSTGKAADSTVDGERLDEFIKNPESKEEIEQILEKVEQQNLQENEELAELVEEAVKESSMADQIEVSFTAQYVQLSMKGALLFESGSAKLREESEKVLDKAGMILERYAKGIIEIEGHTDNVPMSSAKYADNEELSSARALSVFYYLIEHSNLDPVNIRHAGMGERTPIADNSTEEGRSKNRRVEIRIYNSSY